MGAISSIEPGTAYELTGDLPFGEGEHALPSGAVVVLVDILERGTPGVGRTDADAVVVSYRYYDVPTRTAEGEWVYLEHVRHLALSMPVFMERFAPTGRDPAPTKPEAD